MAKLTNDEVLKIVLDESTKAVGSEFGSDELLENRADALKYYNGDLRGDEEPGNSQVISKDIADTVDGMLAQIMPVFSNDSIVSFEANSKEDEEQVRSESSFVNNLIMEQNNGFTIIETAVKDCLLSKNGVAKVRLEEVVDVVKEEYHDLTPEEILAVLKPEQQGESVDVKEFDEVKGNIKLTRTIETKKIIIEPVAPENFAVGVDLNTVSVEDTGYCREKYYLARHKLTSMGYKKAVIDELPAAAYNTQSDAVERDKDIADKVYSNLDKSMQIIEVEDHYVRLDRAGDGSTDLLKVVTSNRKLLEITEVNVVPYAVGVVFLMGHSHYGLSVYDKLKEVQDIKTHFLRMWADNALVNNHNKTDVVPDKVDLESFQNSRPNALRFVESLDAARDVVTADIGPSCEGALNYWDKVRTDRTGSVLNLQSNQVAMPSNVGDQGVNTLVANLELVTGLATKNFSETFIASLYKITHAFVRAYFTDELSAKIAGDWNTTNPSQWLERKQVNVSMPPTASERIVQKLALKEAIGMAENDIASGRVDVFTSAANLYKLRVDLLRLNGINRPENYLVNPSSQDAIQAMKRQQAQQAQQQQVVEAERQEDRKFAKQLQMEALRIQDSEVKRNLQEDVARLELDLYKLQSENKFDYTKLTVEAGIDEAKILSTEEVAEAKIVSDAEVKIGIESMKNINVMEPNPNMAMMNE